MPYPFPPDVQELVLKQRASGRYASEDEQACRDIIASRIRYAVPGTPAAKELSPVSPKILVSPELLMVSPELPSMELHVPGTLVLILWAACRVGDGHP